MISFEDETHSLAIQSIPNVSRLTPSGSLRSVSHKNHVHHNWLTTPIWPSDLLWPDCGRSNFLIHGRSDFTTTDKWLPIL